MEETEFAVIGAGPHGLAAAAHLRRAGAEVRVLGDPMSFWRTMPKGMMLRSNRTATSIAEYDGPLSFTSYCEANGTEPLLPVPLDKFLDYGTWVQTRVAPDVDNRHVDSVEHDGSRFVLNLADGQHLAARRVAVAGGIAPFAHRPSVGADLPPELASHTADHDDLGRFAGKEVIVVGGGQSALESAALLHEAGAGVQVLARAHHVNWLHGGKYHRMLGRYSKLVYAPTDVGPMGLSRIVAVPELFRRFPRAAQDPMAHRAIRPAGAAWLQPRLVDVPIRLGRRLTVAEARGRPGARRDRPQRGAHGGPRPVRHRLPGRRVEVPVPAACPGRMVRTTNGYPLLSRGMESSVPGLHFLGAPAAWSFGPIMRFVAGGWYGAASLTAATTGRRPALTRGKSGSPVAE